MAFSITAQAQSGVHVDNGSNKKKKTQVDFYAFGGANFSSITGSNSNNNGTLVGGQVGAGINVMDFSQILSLRAEAAFSMQGGKYKGSSGSSYSSSGHTRLDYINVPIFCRYQNPGGFYGELGVQPGFLISAKETYSSGSSNGTNDVKSQMNGFDFGIPIGAGYRFKNRIGVGFRVVPGVTNIRKNESTSGYSYNYKEHNLVATVRASYSF